MKELLCCSFQANLPDWNTFLHRNPLAPRKFALHDQKCAHNRSSGVQRRFGEVGPSLRTDPRNLACERAPKHRCTRGDARGDRRITSPPTVFRRMPRYFFHVRRGRVVAIDKVGVELTNLAEAIEEAGRRGREIAAREALSAVAPEPGIIVIDEDWRTVLELPLD